MKLKTYIALIHQNLKCNCEGKHTLVSNNTSNIHYIHIVTRSFIKRGIIGAEGTGGMGGGGGAEGCRGNRGGGGGGTEGGKQIGPAVSSTETLNRPCCFH